MNKTHLIYMENTNCIIVSMHAKFDECYDRKSVVTKISHIAWLVVIFRESRVTKNG